MFAYPGAVALALLKAEKGAALGTEFLIKAEGLVEKAEGQEARTLALRALEMRAGIKGTDTAALQAAADRYLKVSKPTNPAADIQTHLAAARILLRSEPGAHVALELARKAEGLLDANSPPAASSDVLQLLASALRKTGKAEDAKASEAKVAKIEDLIKAVKQANGPHGPYDAKIKKK